MGALKATIDVYISVKFGGLLSGISAVNAAQLYSRHQSALGLIHLRQCWRFSAAVASFVARTKLLNVEPG